MTGDLSRFSSHERLRKWRRDRDLLCLVDEPQLLLGVVWIGEKPLPRRDDYLNLDLMRRKGPRITWAIRLYEPARGNGLAADFANHALKILLTQEGGTDSLWYQTRADNLAARSLGESIGFFEASGEDGGTVVGGRF
jgi:hypothetical protein